MPLPTPDGSFASPFAHAVANRVVDRPGKALSPIFLHGDGRARFLQSVYLRVAERHPEMKILHISFAAFRADFMDLSPVAFRLKYRGLDFLAVDDLHLLAGDMVVQAAFRYIFNAFVRQKKQLVLAAPVEPAEIPDLDERLMFRLQWGVIAKVGP